MNHSPPPPGIQALIGSAPHAISVVAPDFTLVAVNDAFVRAANLARADLLGRNLFDLFPDNPDDPGAEGQANLRASLERVLETRAADRMPVLRYDVRGAPGRGGEFVERHWSPLNYPILGDDGQVTHIIHQAEEVTELVLLRREVVERAAELAEAASVHRAIDDQGLFAVRLDLDGIVIEANRASLEGCGFTRSDVVGRLFWECGWWNRSPAVQGRVEAGFERAARGEPSRGVSPYFWADGTERVVEFSCMPIKDGSGTVRFVVTTGLDVTERHRAERDIRATAILESITDAFFAVDREWRYTYINPQAERLLGREARDLVGKVLWEEYPGLAGSEFERAYLRAAGERVASSVTAHYPDHDRWYEAHAYPAASGISVYFRDVSQRMRAEAERARLAAESERERRIYHTALSNTPDLVYVFGLDQRFLYANEALLKMWGRSLEDAIGKTCLELGYEPWHAEMHGREIDQVAATRRPIRGEVPFTGTNGRRIYDYIFVPVIGADGAVQAVAGTTRDVTERKGAEEALRISEQRFRVTADHAPVLIWISDTEKLCHWFNQPWLDFTGHAMGELVGHGWAADVHPDDYGRCLDTFVASFDARRRFTMEYRLRRHDGVYRWILDNGVPLHGPGGEFAGYIGSCVDIHDRIEAERSLKEADRRKDEFLAMLAHELRNPLAAVGNAVAVLRKTDEREGLDFARDVIDRQTRQLARLIDDLLDVSRINSGKIRLKKESCDAVPILEHAIQSVRPLIEERKHHFEAEFPGGPLPLRADPIRIEQVVVNLLTNAAKYTEAGGRIRLVAGREGERIVIEVRDNGVGIPPEKLPEMFRLFAQGERSIARSEGGLGIGLTIVQRLTELHGGRVVASSEGPGRGSRFAVHLPAAAASPTPKPRRGPATPAGGRGSRILVVDDNVDTARGLARLLRLLGHAVELAHDGHSAIDIARNLGPEYVLLDIGLPGMDGYQVARRLRQEPVCKAPVIIAVSGYGQEEDRRRSREAGFDHHLVKPVDFDSLVALLARTP